MKYLYFTMTVIVGIVIIVLTQSPQANLIILTSPHIYSHYHSDDQDTFRIDVLSNLADHYAFDVGYVTSAKITNEDVVFPLDIRNVTIGTIPYDFQDRTYYMISFYAQVSVFHDDQFIHIPNAQLALSYSNGTTIQLDIGEWNYRFLENQQDDLTFQTLQATYATVHDVETVSGITIELVNRTSDILTITGFDLLTPQVYVDTANIIETACEGHITVEECIGRPYSFTAMQHDQPTSIILLGHQSKTLYLPLKYNTVSYFHQGAMEITYRLHNDQRTWVIDDFPYMNTSSFQQDYEPYYEVYTNDSD